jgi:hypothetical protein
MRPFASTEQRRRALARRRTQASVIVIEPDAEIREKIRVAMFSLLAAGEVLFAGGKAEAIRLMAGHETKDIFGVEAVIAGRRVPNLESGKERCA